MKKVLAIILAVMMMFTLVSLTSCTDNTVSDDVNDESNVNGENNQNADANDDEQNSGDVSNEDAAQRPCVHTGQGNTCYRYHRIRSHELQGKRRMDRI